MKWEQIRQHYPHQWLLVEAIKAHSEGNKRIAEELAVIEMYEDSLAAMQGYKLLRRQWPQREFYVLHTDRQTIDITERYWQGIRGLR